MGKSLTGRKLPVGVTQRKDGLYTARYTDQAGRRIEQYFHNPQDAKAWLDAEKHFCSHVARNVDQHMTVDQWFNYWIEHIKEPTVRYNTCRNYRERYRFNIGPVIGQMRIRDVKTLHCQMVLNEMEADYSCSTIEQTRIQMCSMFYYAAINQVIPISPVNKMIKVPKEAEKKIRYFTLDEELRFLEEAKSRSNYGQYLLALNTGMRVGEIMGLRWGDIDFENRFIHINQTMEFRFSVQEYHVGPPKTPHSKRRIPMTDIIYNMLKDRYDHRKERFVKEKQWEEYVFLNRKGIPVKNTAYNTALCKICDDAGVKRLSMHSLRHTYATRCIEAGMRPKTLQEILGHAHLSTTMDLYVHNTDEEKVNEQKKFESSFEDRFKIVL